MDNGTRNFRKFSIDIVVHILILPSSFNQLTSSYFVIFDLDKISYYFSGYC